MAAMSSSDGDRITFGRWLASGPFKRPPREAEAYRLELAWNTALRIGRESEPPGPGPGYDEALAEYVQRGPRL
jgi:hypothetical protein